MGVTSSKAHMPTHVSGVREAAIRLTMYPRATTTGLATPRSGAEGSRGILVAIIDQVRQAIKVGLFSHTGSHDAVPEIIRPPPTEGVAQSRLR